MSNTGLKSLLKPILKIIFEKEVPSEKVVNLRDSFISSLKVLNLSLNNLDDESVIYLAHFLEESPVIATLLLHWNRIKAPGSILMANALSVNESLAILDLSFNSMTET